MTMPPTIDIGRALLDRLVTDVDGLPLGRVDDIELRIPEAGGPPVIEAILCGPMALGPRLGGRVGTWWLSVGRRLRPESNPEPVRIPLALVTELRPGEVRLSISRDDAGTLQLRDWVLDKLIAPLPGSGVAT
jgi:hypothetical protein